MQVVFVALAAVVLGVGFLSSNHVKTSDDTLTATETPLVEVGDVLSDEADETPEPSDTPEPTEEPTNTPSPTVAPTSNSVSQTNNISLSGYVYPGSTVVTSRDNYLELNSNASANTITDWYRSLLKSNNFSINSAIKTSTNGVVSNKLVGSDGDSTIEVNISADNSSAVLITVRKV